MNEPSELHGPPSVGDTVVSTSGRFLGQAEVLRVRDGVGAHAVLEVQGSGQLLTVPLGELRRVPGVLPMLLAGQFGTPGAFDARLLAAVLEAEDHRSGLLRRTKIERLPHQILTALRVLESPNPNHLIADDVGLGKTIEVGLIINALLARGSIRRVLIVTPAGLTVQWQEQLEDLFGIYFDVFRRDFSDYRKDAWQRHDRVIASLDAIKRRDRRSVLEESPPWDLLVVDEAHKLTARRESTGKEQKTQNYLLVETLRDKFGILIFASATPHQGDDARFALLLRLLRPDIFVSADSLPGNRGRLGELITRNRKSRVTDEHGGLVFRGHTTHSVDALPTPAEQQFLEDLETYIRSSFGATADWSAAQSRIVGFVLAAFGKLAASSPPAIASALAGRLKRLQSETEAAKDGDEGEVDERFAGEREETLATESLTKRFFDDEAAVLAQLIADARSLGRGAKAQVFVERVRSIRRQPDFRGGILVFTEYRATQSMLVEMLKEAFPALPSHVINGSMSLDAKRGAVAAFDSQGGFLVSTEAGGEGLNLQRNCHVMLNYDLPWNPMRLQQRIGRLDRFGQTSRVIVFNLRHLGTKDDLIREYLDRKIESVMATMAAVQEDPEDLRTAILGEVETEVNMEEIYLRAVRAGSLDDRTREEIDAAMERARRAVERTGELFGGLETPRAEYDANRPKVGSVEIEAFVRAFLKEEGRRLMEREPGVYAFVTPDSLRQNRKLQERYDAVIFDGSTLPTSGAATLMRFGHPAFDAMIARTKEHTFGGYAAQRTVSTAPTLASLEGVQVNFSLTVRGSGVNRKDRIVTVFIDSNGNVRSDVSGEPSLLISSGEWDATAPFLAEGYLKPAFATAFATAEQELRTMQTSENDVANIFLLNAAVVRLTR